MGLKLNLNGVDPRAQREYVWIGDDAVLTPVEEPALLAWISSGTVPPLREGVEPVRFRTRALTPTVLAIAQNHATVSPSFSEPSPEPAPMREMYLRNLPASMRIAFAYGVVAIQGADAPKLERVLDSGGWRVADDLIDAIDRQCTFAGTSLVQHLGSLILFDSRPTELESKP